MHISPSCSRGLLELGAAGVPGAAGSLPAGLRAAAGGQGAGEELPGEPRGRKAPVLPSGLPDVPLQGVPARAPAQGGERRTVRGHSQT